jgi:putative hydrolase
LKLTTPTLSIIIYVIVTAHFFIVNLYKLILFKGVSMKLSGIQFEIDTHIHTIVSGHSWSSLTDYIYQAKRIGMKGFCLTEHGPAMPNGPPEFTAHTQLMIPNYYDSIYIFKGLEADIIDFQGKLDVRNSYLKKLDFCIASMHTDCIKSGTSQQTSDIYAAVLSNPNVDMIGHPDDPRSPCNLEDLVLETKKYNKLIEINNSSLTPHRKDCRRNVYELAQLCKIHDVRICVSSDAHWHTMMGSFDPAKELLDELNFPVELIINLTLNGFQDYVKERSIKL